MEKVSVNYNLLILVLSITTLLVGVFAWWLSKFLTDKRDMTILQVKQEQHEKDIADLERRVSRLEDKR